MRRNDCVAASKRNGIGTAARAGSVEGTPVDSLRIMAVTEAAVTINHGVPSS